MKFHRQERYEPITLTDRKRAAFARKQANERARYPLFSDHVADEQHTLADELARRQLSATSSEQSLRDFHARTWRKSRALFQQQPPDIKETIRRAWATWVGPRTSTYYAWHIDKLSGEQAKRCAAYEQERTVQRARLPAQCRAQPGRLF